MEPWNRTRLLNTRPPWNTRWTSRGSNAKEAKRLLDDAIAKREAGEVNDDRVSQLQSLLDLANEDLKRVTREQ